MVEKLLTLDDYSCKYTMTSFELFIKLNISILHKLICPCLSLINSHAPLPLSVDFLVSYIIFVTNLYV
jgi:hypothetical protein